MRGRVSSRRARSWRNIAYRWMLEYSKANRRFISEECTHAARAAGITPLDDPRAWGSVFRRAAQDGIIRRAGYRESPLRHLSPTILWESLLYGGTPSSVASDALDDHTAPVA